VAQSTPPVAEGEVRAVVEPEVFALRDAGIVAVVEIAADEDENGEAEAEAREPVARGNFEDHIPHFQVHIPYNHGHAAGPFLEVAAGEEEYGMREEGYAVEHWCMPNVDGVEGEAAD